MTTLRNNSQLAATAAIKALKGRPDVKQECNPCDRTQAIAANRPANLRRGVNDCKLIVCKTSNSLKTKTKRAFALLLMLALLAPAAAWAQSFGGGSGTETDPYLIATTDHMDALVSQVNGGNSFSGTYFKMTADLDYTGKGYSIIGNYNNRFCGSFNGDGHTISNVSLSGNGDTKGVFGAIGSGGIVMNLTLDQSSISGISGIGGIAGYIENATISNCINRGSITTPNFLNCQSIGGIVGYATNSSIIDCQNQGEVRRHDNAVCSATGGIVGRAENNCNISGCQNSAYILGTENTGGIAGQANGGTIISHCKSTEIIQGESRGGGIVGYANGAIVSHCCNTSPIEMRDGPAGGIVGRAEASSVSNCLNLRSAHGHSSYNYASGGIVGWNYGDGNSYTNNYYRGNAYGISDYSTTMPVDVPGQAMRAYMITGVSPVVVSLPEGATVGVAYEGNVYAGYEQSVVMNLDIPNPSITQQCYTLSAGTLEDNGDGTYTITMPEENITVSGNVVKYESFYYQLDCGGNNKAMVVQHDSYATLDWASIEDFEYEGVQYAVTAIADGAFDGCSDLEGVGIHAPQLATIGVNAFRSCTNLGSFGLYNCTTPPALGRGAFTNVPLADMLLGVPYCSQYAYSQHEVFGQCGNIQGYDGCEYNFWNQYGEGDGLWSNPANWMDANQEVCAEVPGEGAQVAIFAECEIDVDVTVGSITAGSMDETAPVTVKTGKTLTATNYIYTANDPENLIIEDGAQVYHPNAGAKATVEKNITAYTPNTKDGYHLIGHSFADNGAVSEMDNLLANDYDLYYYDEPTHYWMNQKQTANNFTELEAAKGYLYANSVSQTIGLKGTLNAANALVNIPLSYEADALKGFNLVGNPFAHNVTTFAGTNVATEVYRMNGTKDNLMVSTISATDPLTPGEGFFVKATGDGASITFNAQTRGEAKVTELAEVPTITLNLTQDGLIVDRFILKRDGEPLEKFTLNENATRIYATEGGKNYAVATVGRDAKFCVSTEVPINFKAAKNGTYTLTFNTQHLDLDYLHLIDNLTGADVDLLSAGDCGSESAMTTEGVSYTFTAKTTDYASRFRLVFSTPADGPSANRAFAYIADGKIHIVADAFDASLQVVDVMGRVIVSTGGHTRCVPAVGMMPGVYVLRLIDGNNVRTQKIVID